MGFWGFGEQYVTVFSMYLVQLHVVPKTPKPHSKKSQIIYIINKLIKVTSFFLLKKSLLKRLTSNQI